MYVYKGKIVELSLSRHTRGSVVYWRTDRCCSMLCIAAPKAETRLSFHIGTRGTGIAQSV
jgi:hypothetical protein